MLQSRGESSVPASNLHSMEPTFVPQVAEHPSANRGDLRAVHVGQQALAHPDGQVDAHHLLGCHLSSAHE